MWLLKALLVVSSMKYSSARVDHDLFHEFDKVDLAAEHIFSSGFIINQRKSAIVLSMKSEEINLFY